MKAVGGLRHMAANYALDTNIIIAVFRNHMAIKERMLMLDSFFVPAVVLGELFFGVQRAARPEFELQRIRDFLTGVDESRILACDYATSQVYGLIKGRQTAIGRPLPENDYWIAAVTYQHDLTLVTRDSHFRDITGLSIEAWD